MKKFERYFSHFAMAGRYLFSGGTAAGTNLLLLYVCTEYFHIWYIASSMIAFLVAFLVSFTLQKFWTFQDKETGAIHAQMGKYLAVALLNLGLNTLMLFSLVEYAQFHYIPAQIVTMGTIAVVSFFIYRHFIFHQGMKK